MNWQPIETAPKDGTEIVIAKRGWEVMPVAAWAEYPDNPVENAEGEQCTMMGWVIESVWFSEGMEESFLGWNEDIEEGHMPTHWMPLPEPPHD